MTSLKAGRERERLEKRTRSNRVMKNGRERWVNRCHTKRRAKQNRHVMTGNKLPNISVRRSRCVFQRFMDLPRKPGWRRTGKGYINRQILRYDPNRNKNNFPCPSKPISNL